MVEGLLILSDGTVQTIGQIKSYAPFIPYLYSLQDQLEQKIREENFSTLREFSENDLQKELERRKAEKNTEVRHLKSNE